MRLLLALSFLLLMAPLAAAQAPDPFVPPLPPNSTWSTNIVGDLPTPVTPSHAMAIQEYLRDLRTEGIFTAVMGGEPVEPAYAFDEEFDVRLILSDIPMADEAPATLSVSLGLMAYATAGGVELYTNVPYWSSTVLDMEVIGGAGGTGYVEFEGVPGYLGSTYTFTTAGQSWPVNIVAVRPHEPGVSIQCEDVDWPSTTGSMVPVDCNECSDEEGSPTLPSVEVKGFGCADPCIVYPDLLGMCTWPDVCANLPVGIKAVCEEDFAPCGEVECPGSPCTDPPAFLEEVCATPKPDVCETVGILAPEAAETMCGIEVPDPLEWCPTLMACLPTDPCMVEVGKESICNGFDPCVEAGVLGKTVSTCGSLPVDPCSGGDDSEGGLPVNACEPPGPDPIVLCDIHDFPVMCSGELPGECAEGGSAPWQDVCEQLGCYGMTLLACLVDKVPGGTPEPESSTMSGGGDCVKLVDPVPDAPLREATPMWQDRGSPPDDIPIDYDGGEIAVRLNVNQRCGPDYMTLANQSTFYAYETWEFNTFHEQTATAGTGIYKVASVASTSGQDCCTDFEGKAFKTITRPKLFITTGDLPGTDSKGRPWYHAPMSAFFVQGRPQPAMPATWCQDAVQVIDDTAPFADGVSLALDFLKKWWIVGFLMTATEMGITEYCQPPDAWWRTLETDYDNHIGIKTKKKLKAVGDEQELPAFYAEFDALDIAPSEGDPYSLLFLFDVFLTVDSVYWCYGPDGKESWCTHSHDVSIPETVDDRLKHRTMKVT